MKRISSTLLFLYAFLSVGYGQYYGSNNRNNWHVGLNVGINNFFGDISNTKNKLLISDPFTKDFYQNRNAMCQLSIGYDIFPAWNLRFNILYGNIEGKNSHLNLKFKSYHTHEFSLLNSMNVFAFTHIDDWQLNLHLGAGVYAFKTSLLDLESNKYIQEKPKNFTHAFSMPFGLGFGYNFSENWRFTFDLMYRWVANDALDAYQSDLKKFEGFSYAAIGIQYSFDLPSIHFTRARRSFKQADNYRFPAMGTDPTHKIYRQRKQRGNLHPVNNYNKKQRKLYKNINSRTYIINSRKKKELK